MIMPEKPPPVTLEINVDLATAVGAALVAVLALMLAILALVLV